MNGDDVFLASLPQLSEKQLLDELDVYAGFDPYHADLRKALFTELYRRQALREKHGCACTKDQSTGR
jgi:hypothetical protein